ncbi:hypothetical protein TYRP_003396 [Tyrophagus putrescentiae]|nr:hypothetical protein TYRP_003396 [Tyrophagus putrescentiae]
MDSSSLGRRISMSFKQVSNQPLEDKLRPFWYRFRRHCNGSTRALHTHTAHTAFPPCQQQQQCILSSSGSSTPSPGSLAPSAPEHSCAGSSIQQQQLRHSSPLLFSSLSLSTPPPQQHSSNWAPLLDPLLASSSFSVLERD